MVNRIIRERLEDGVAVARAGHEEEREGGRFGAAAERPHEVESGHPRHPEVAGDDTDRLGLDDLERISTIRRCRRLQSAAPEREHQERAEIVIVLDDQDDAWRRTGLRIQDGTGSAIVAGGSAAMETPVDRRSGG